MSSHMSQMFQRYICYNIIKAQFTLKIGSKKNYMLWVMSHESWVMSHESWIIMNLCNLCLYFQNTTLTINHNDNDNTFSWLLTSSIIYSSSLTLTKTLKCQNKRQIKCQMINIQMKLTKQRDKASQPANHICGIEKLEGTNQDARWTAGGGVGGICPRTGAWTGLCFGRGATTVGGWGLHITILGSSSESSSTIRRPWRIRAAPTFIGIVSHTGLQAPLMFTKSSPLTQRPKTASRGGSIVEKTWTTSLTLQHNNWNVSEVLIPIKTGGLSLENKGPSESTTTTPLSPFEKQCVSRGATKGGP